MKSLLFFTLFAGLALFTSCGKGNEEQIVFTKTNPVRLTRQVNGPYVEIKGELHSYAKRRMNPHKGQPCGCNWCFGICDFSVGVGWNSGLIKLVDDNTARFYLVGDIDYASNLFQIGSDMQIPASKLAGVTDKNITILEGDYQFTPISQTVYENGVAITTHGYADLNIVTN